MGNDKITFDELEKIYDEVYNNYDGEDKNPYKFLEFVFCEKLTEDQVTKITQEFKMPGVKEYLDDYNILEYMQEYVYSWENKELEKKLVAKYQEYLPQYQTYLYSEFYEFIPNDEEEIDLEEEIENMLSKQKYSLTYFHKSESSVYLTIENENEKTMTIRISDHEAGKSYAHSLHSFPEIDLNYHINTFSENNVLDALRNGEDYKGGFSQRENLLKTFEKLEF